jgi:hypothetical protein
MPDKYNIYITFINSIKVTKCGLESRLIFFQKYIHNYDKWASSTPYLDGGRLDICYEPRSFLTNLNLNNMIWHLKLCNFNAIYTTQYALLY